MGPIYEISGHHEDRHPDSFAKHLPEGIGHTRKGTRPMCGRVLGWAAMVLTPVAMSQPVAAQSSDCDLLSAQLAGTTGDLLGIAQDYPRTHAALVGCMMSQNTEQDRKGCAAAVILAACVGMGSEGCSDLTSRWSRVSHNYQAIAMRMQQLGCRQ